MHGKDYVETGGTITIQPGQTSATFEVNLVDADDLATAVFAEDLAAQAVEAGSHTGDSVADAAGQDTFSFEGLLRLLATSMGSRRWFLNPPSVRGALVDQAHGPADARRGAHPRGGGWSDCLHPANR